MRQARMLVEDCEAAITRYACERKKEDLAWQWLAIVALLKSISLVLHRGDAINSAQHLRNAINDRWHRLCLARPEPRIYWGFIDCEWDRILCDHRKAIVIAPRSRPRNQPKRSLATFRSEVLIGDGGYAGRSSAEVAIAALEWWTQYLDEIDVLAQSYA